MQTDDLISLMTASHQKVDTGGLRRATWLAALAALAVTAGLVLVTLGARHDFASAWMTLPVLAKAALGASVAVVALGVFQSSLRPGLKRGHLLWLAAVPLALVVGWALATLAQAPAGQWSALVFGRYWLACLIAVPLYAICPFVALLVLARRGAPVDGRLTGFSAGIASAGLATVAYSLHCPDDAVPFLASWYPLAMAAVAGFGALVFPRFVRW
ncbi:DUF1109 family protein [Bosea caraganae]|uniref:DUF1109 family protein n=1 Tax=Bosea caraganae TaxID=2763117 RepID=A0A370L816_9HYPH|nr:DUF1109 domain-containing protein [Bosea caraganae]RDJ25194.1 DUF1109 family protein [Bosea caraganae]RDJ26304.1 DUF1109 family protein [Bosea caraganae]